MAKKRTVTKTKAADGSKSRTVTRKKKDGNTKVKSKTKSGGVVTKRKVTVGPKSTSTSTQRMGDPTLPSWHAGSAKSLAREKAKRLILGGGGNRSAISVEKKTTSQSVKGKETVKNRKAKKGEVRKTKSKIDGNRISTTGTVTSSNIDPASTGRLRRESSRSDIVKTNKTRVTPAAKTTVKTKTKKRGRKNPTAGRDVPLPKS